MKIKIDYSRLLKKLFKKYIFNEFNILQIPFGKKKGKYKIIQRTSFLGFIYLDVKTIICKDLNELDLELSKIISDEFFRRNI